MKKVHARLVGTVPAPPRRPRWWQWCPPWCVRRDIAVPPRQQWVSYRVPLVMEPAVDGRTSNSSTLVWGGPWPPDLALEKVEIEDEHGAPLFWCDLDVSRRPMGPSDTMQVAPGGLRIEVS